MSVTRDSGRVPFWTASTRRSPQKEDPLGIAMSRPASAAATPACRAFQSVTTHPCRCRRQTSSRRGKGGRGTPYLVSKLHLEQSVEGLAVGAAVRVVDTLVGAHDVPGPRVHGIHEGPVMPESVPPSTVLELDRGYFPLTRGRAHASSCRRCWTRRPRCSPRGSCWSLARCRCSAVITVSTTAS